MTSPIEMAKKALGGLGPQGQAAAMALALATAGVTAVVGAIVGGMTVAIGVVETMTQRLTALSALAGGAKAGAAAEASIQKLSATLPFATSQLSQWASGLLAAGVPASQLESRIKGIAAAEALMKAAGGGGGEAAADLFKKLGAGGAEADAFMKKIAKGGKAADAELKRMGLTLAEVGGKAAVAKMSAQQFAEVSAKALQVKGGGALAAMGNTFEVIAMKAKEGFMSLFTGIKTEPFMASVKGLFSMFNKGSPTMAALRGVITSVFGTLFSWATKGVGVVQAVFQQLVIAALKVRIGINPIVVALRQLSAEMSKAIAATGLFQGKSSALAAVMTFVGNAIAGAFKFAVYSVAFFIGGMIGMMKVATMVITRVRAIFKGLSLPSLAGAAGTMISSFVSGIVANLGAVMGAMKGMGAAAKKALFGALGIASPSKVALEAAGNVTSTFSDKVDDGKADTQKAFAGMVKMPPAGKGAGGGGSGGATAALVAALDRVASALEMSPGMHEAMILAFAEAEQEGA
jgi:hypothetical protein